MAKRTQIRLSTKAIDTLKQVYDTNYKSRVIELEKISEYSFSILLYWNRIEGLLKTLKYQHKILESYPDRLNFINRNWTILKNVSNTNVNNYKKILGDGRVKDGCLWDVRNKIVHTNHRISKSEYDGYKSASTWMIAQLLTNLPETTEKAKQSFLSLKKSKIQKARM